MKTELLDANDYAKDIEIGPCPFCGHDPDGVERELVDIGSPDENDIIPTIPAYFVVCGWCSAQGPVVEAGADVDLTAYKTDPRNLTSAQAVQKCIELWNELSKRNQAVHETAAKIAYHMGRQDQQRFVDRALQRKQKDALFDGVPAGEWIAQEAKSFPDEPVSLLAIVRAAEAHHGVPGTFYHEDTCDGLPVKEGEIGVCEKCGGVWPK